VFGEFQILFGKTYTVILHFLIYSLFLWIGKSENNMILLVSSSIVDRDVVWKVCKLHSVCDELRFCVETVY
jgi:hypothetical protein